MKYLIILCFSFTAVTAQDTPDFQALFGKKNGFYPMGHGSIVFYLGKTTVYVDPSGNESAYKDLNPPDIILITDFHGDHFNKSSIEQLIADETSFIVPKVVFDLMPEVWKTNASVLANGEDMHLKGLDFGAVAMYNTSDTKKNFHEKGRGNGYVIEYDDQHIYISGDTEDIPEMRSLRRIDVAFVCMNEPYTMSVDQAASAVNEFKPKVVYPFHYRNRDKSLSDTKRFKTLVEEGVEVRLLNWYGSQ